MVKERETCSFTLLYDWIDIINETTDGTGAGVIFFNDFMIPLLLCDQEIIYGKGESSHAIYLVPLEKVSQVASPESIFRRSCLLFVNLGLPTILAHDWWRDCFLRDVDRLYFYQEAGSMVCDYLLGIVGRIILITRGWPANDTMVETMRNGLLC